MRVTIVGTGDLGRALGHIFDELGQKDGNIEVFGTEPLPDVDVGDFLVESSIPILPFEEALSTSDLLILAIPARALTSFVMDNFSKLPEDTIVVDPTNSPKEGEDLKGVLQKLGIGYFDQWVKAFNDTGAAVLFQQKASFKTPITTKICGPNKVVVNKVARVVEAFGFTPKIVQPDHFDEIRRSQETIGIEWIVATAVMFTLFVLIFIYTICASWQKPGFVWWQLPLRYMSQAFAWTAIYGFALSLAPGLLLRLRKQFIGFQSRPSKVTLWGLRTRKQVGLISLYFVFLHACIVLFIFGGEYFRFLLADPRDRMRWMGETSMLFGILSLSLLSIVGIASLPSVGNSMTKAQASLVFGPVVWFGLILGILHVIFLGYKSWDEKDENMHAWPGDMVPITIMSILIPLAVVALKLVQVTHVILLRGRSMLCKAEDENIAGSIGLHPDHLEGDSATVEHHELEIEHISDPEV